MSELQNRALNKARTDLLEVEHNLTSREGVLTWLAAVGCALTHDLPEMPRQKANTSALVGSVALKAIAT
jgi:hypothetical protein